MSATACLSSRSRGWRGVVQVQAHCGAKTPLYRRVLFDTACTHAPVAARSSSYALLAFCYARMPLAKGAQESNRECHVVPRRRLRAANRSCKQCFCAIEAHADQLVRGTAVVLVLVEGERLWRALH